MILIKLIKVYKLSSSFQTWKGLRNKLITRSISGFCFDSDEEIITNTIENVRMIGFNLPDTKNVLTEAALHKFRECIKNFEDDDDCSCGVLHGSGGNFCTGTVQTDEAMKLSEDILKMLHTLKKPLIGALNGYTTNYGFHLAVMCDLRIMEDSAVVGLKDTEGKQRILPFVRERLILNVGMARTMVFLGTKQSVSGNDAFVSNFVIKLVEPGCALGQSLVYAKSLTFNSSLQSLIEEKSKILSFLTTKT